MPIHKEATFRAPPERIYELLTDVAQFAALTGQPAEIEMHEGGTFSIFAGMWRGRHIELVPVSGLSRRGTTQIGRRLLIPLCDS